MRILEITTSGSKKRARRRKRGKKTTRDTKRERAGRTRHPREER